MDPSELKSGDPCWFRKSISFLGNEGWVRARIKGVHGVFSEHPSYVVIVDGEEWHGNQRNTRALSAVDRLAEVSREEVVEANTEIQQGPEGSCLGG